jgi:lipoprotein NlpD
MRWQNSANLPSAVARAVAPIVIAALVAACATRPSAPIEDRVARPPPAVIPAPPAASAPVEGEPRAKTYTVKRGDTLQQIAMDQGLDYRELANWNSLENPNVIRVGQVLRLTPPGEAINGAGVTTTPLRPPPAVVEARPTPPIIAVRPGDNVKSTPKALKEPYSEQAVREVTQAGVAQALSSAATASSAENIAVAPRVEPKPEAAQPATTGPGGDDRLDWTWPAKGKLVGTFSETANLKGIDIAGKAGEPVVASAPGKVVYAGTGLRGYGKLIIIKHNNTFLSAYAHNREILVKEGQQVTKGQKIAEMGNSDADQVKLHFEIRRLGKPMDPARYLPPA